MLKNRIFKDKNSFRKCKLTAAAVILFMTAVLSTTTAHAGSATSSGAYIDPSMYTFTHTVSFSNAIVSGEFTLYKHGNYMFEFCTVSCYGVAIGSDGAPTGSYSASTSGASDVTTGGSGYIYSYPPVRVHGNATKDGVLVNALTAY